MEIGEKLYNEAVKLVNERYPLGWGGAAAIRTETGRIITSISPDVKNDALALCMEVGSYLEAQKYNEKVTHSLCVSRESESSKFKILTPCGVCQERLVYWGGDVLAAVSNLDQEVIFKTLRELQPYHWLGAYGQNL
ncbi:cytidine deaminase [Thiolapillus brandeum]|uniref:Cytidine deaminase n=1 Tax=Thiolapillus brandeum TaxID=1076588 RepID=A0A7U6JK01_9GAMM|nr:cytidine deaminase [Thiolapillus brandeum]BAO45788.1 cytidine deaminase [Thiolapillus brandeum]